MGITGPGDFLGIHPTELKFPFELRKQNSSSLQLTNKSDQYVAFKVKTTNPRKYSVRPNAGVILPRSICNVKVTMQALKELPPDMQCKDRFLIESVVVHDGAMVKDINQEMFTKGDGKVIGKFRLRVAYIPANPPSPVPEEPEEDSSSVSSSMDDADKSSSLPEAVVRSWEEPTDVPSSSEAFSMISKLMEEKDLAIQQNRKIDQELVMIRKRICENHAGGYSWLFVILVGLFGILVGYVIKRT